MAPSSWWTEQVVPRAVDVALSERATHPWRETVCGGAAGVVLDVGFGSGRNLSHYPAAVSEVLAVEPSDVAWAKAAERLARFGRPVRRVATDAARLPLADGSVDTAVTTWTMCVIPDLETALAEVRRVLRPGGSLRFVEHSLAPEPVVRRVQHGLQPVWGPLAGGCHLNRDLPALVSAAGFTLGELERRYVSRVWPVRPFGWFVTGAATPSQR